MRLPCKSRMPSVLAGCRPEALVSRNRRPPGQIGVGANKRARQSLAIRSWQPWKRSTGPKSDAGKAVVARNAVKHDGRSADTLAELKALRQLLAQCSERLDGAR